MMNPRSFKRLAVRLRPGWVRWWLAMAIAGLVPGAGWSAPASRARIDFNRDIRPIFSENCYACHGPDQAKRKAGLRLDVRESALAKLDSGEFPIVAGRPEQSRLLSVIALPPDDDEHMPPAKTGKQLSTAQWDLLRRWIEQGAKWSEHWAYIAPVRPPVPPIADHGSRIVHPIDSFILAELEKKGLKPNPEADRYTHIRRLSLDLTGLPPTIREVDEFVADKNANAYEKVVDQLLASPHCGERLALVWLDQARYADTSGYHFDGFRQMHLWRDWVIQSFNDNKPFDQFTIEQLAGDLLPDATMEQKIATGFHRNVMTTDEGGVDPEEYLAKYQVDRVSTTAQVWLGTTLGCAECHDHKFDPITTREFYQFFAFFNSIAEKGLDGTRVRNPGPVLKVPTAEQGSALFRYLELLPVAEKAVIDREAELPKAYEKWEKQILALPLQPPASGGLVAVFGFDEKPAGTNAASGWPAKAGDTNGPTTVPGKISLALHCRARTDDVLDAGQAVHFDREKGFSFGAWIKLHGKTGAVFSKMDGGPAYRGFDLLVNDGKIEVHLVHQFPDNAIKVATKSAIPTNLWTHLFVTYDGSSKAAGVRTFVDGRLTPVEVAHDKLTASITNATPLLLGGRLKEFPFNGLIDDVRFYNRAVSSEESGELFHYAHLRLAHLAADLRTEEETSELRRFFREQVATDYVKARDQLAQVRKEKEEMMAKIPDSMVMVEMEKPRDTFILARGNYQLKGERVTPGTPACWPPLPAGQPANRLALARWIASTNHPLTARVAVNRWWAMLFGTGLVKTANDFGSQGDRPSHPELLDWLACEFMEGGSGVPAPGSGDPGNSAAGQTPEPRPWSVKRLLRLIVTSATYRQSAAVSRLNLERDPFNRLLTRGPRLRLDAELIRDNALAISGLLNARIGGPSVKPYQPPGLWEGTDHKYEPSKGADLYRRGMYVLWKRAAHYPSFQTFDAPSREICTLLRPRTSTPLQSLVMMNDPVYVEAARGLAARALREGGASLAQQLTHAFRLTLARPPDRKELEILEKAFRQQHENFAHDKTGAEALLTVGDSPRPPDLDIIQLAAMTGVASVLLNLNETISK